MGYDADTDDAQRLYRENVFVGIGRGDSHDEALRQAFDQAWGKAKSAGKERKPLRVAEQYVAGENPINWCKIVLVDDAP